MNTTRTRRSGALHLAVALTALACAVAPPAAAQHQHHDSHAQHAKHDQAAARQPTAQPANLKLTDTPLLDQDGRTLKFKSEALGERIAVIGFVYTTCTTVCPVISALMLQLQEKLGARLGQDVGLVTITVDPARDTPARMKEYGSRLGAGPGWTMLTGPKPQVDEVLKVFGAYTPNFTDHPPLVMVGDARSDRWLRFYGFPSPDELMRAVGELTAARTRTQGAG